ncbi:MAG: FAD-dependent oxidoreductase [Sphingobacteriales bacterium]|jgi:glycerol-3-phosphate dehydrogenase
MNREQELSRLRSEEIWDLVVIGGGATGLGIAVDAASRGYKVALFEKNDFAKGTSGRSTKLIHGGVRYLAQGNIKLVKEALRERGILLKNAPHITGAQPFIVPVYSIFSFLFYGIGLSIYDILAGKLQIGKVSWLGKKKVLEHLPSIHPTGLKGGILYYDGQFDDARLAITLGLTAADHGACLLNYMDVKGFEYSDKKISGVKCQDVLSGNEFRILSKSVINATGIFADHLIAMDKADQPAMLTPSQGVHIVVDPIFFQGSHAMMIPKTDDGRILFAVPWNGKVVIGTTDTAVKEISDEPEAFDEEIDFIMRNFNQYSGRKLERKNILSVFAGLRPLVKSTNKGSTALMSRDHTILVSVSGLITIIGGKWTTYRKMAKDAVENAIFVGKLKKTRCITDDLRLRGWTEEENPTQYGADLAKIKEIEKESKIYAEKWHPDYPFTRAELIWMIREELAMQLEDVLARRTRLLLLDAGLTIRIAPRIVEWMAQEMNKDEKWKADQLTSFNEIAQRYIL